MYLKNDLERVHKRALAIIYPCIEYSEALSRAGIPTVLNYNQTVCNKTFNSILNDDENRLHRLLPAADKLILFRRNRRFDIHDFLPQEDFLLLYYPNQTQRGS